MRLFNSGLFRKVFIALFVCALMSRASFAPAADEVSEFDKLDHLRNDFSSPFEDVTPDHWAYKAVKHLADLGLLEGYEGKDFLGNKVVTRYELAILISRLFDNYVKVRETGALPVRRQVVSPAAAIGALGAPTALAGTESGTAASARRIAPVETIIVPSANLPAPAPIGPAGLKRRGPLELDGLAAAPPAPAPTPVEARIEQVEQKITLTLKDVEELEKLVNSFSKELKEINRALKKEISEGKKIGLKNERDIQKLKEENERFNVTGENDFIFASFGATHGREQSGSNNEDTIPSENACPDDSDDYDNNDDTKNNDNDTSGDYPDCLTDFPQSGARDNMREVMLVDTLKLYIKSKPKPKEDLTLGATILTKNNLTGTGGYNYDLNNNGVTISKSRKRATSPLYLSEIYVDYQNTVEDPKNPKNFKLRQMKLGEISLTYSPLTAFMLDLTGAQMQFKLNKYTIDFFGARTDRHPDSVFKSQIDAGDPSKSRYYDRYFFGASVGFPLFGEALSLNKVTKVFLFDDADTPYPGCLGHTGEWVNVAQDYDIRTSKLGLSDAYFKDVFCLPPEKNSVTSFFTRYPLFDGKILFTGEYAHSTFYKPGYFARKPDQDECDWLGTSGAINCFKVPAQEYQDDAFLAMVEYAKPPIKIFPLGYARLGPKFTTKFFGLPGMDMNSLMGGGMGFLPFNVQSMELWIAGAGIDRIIDKNYSYDTMYVTGHELAPIYFDIGELFASFSTNELKGTITDVLPKPLNFINNRTNKLNLNVWMNKFKYVLSDKLSMRAEYLNVKAVMPTACVDSNLVPVYNDSGNQIDLLYGDGKADCDNGNPPLDINKLGIDVGMNEQKYLVNWTTSKETTYEGMFKISELALKFKWDNIVEGVIDQLAPKGKTYMFSNELTHKLTQSTDLKLGYVTAFDTFPDSDDSSRFPVIDQDLLYFNVNSRF